MDGRGIVCGSLLTLILGQYLAFGEGIVLGANSQLRPHLPTRCSSFISNGSGDYDVVTIRTNGNPQLDYMGMNAGGKSKGIGNLRYSLEDQLKLKEHLQWYSRNHILFYHLMLDRSKHIHF